MKELSAFDRLAETARADLAALSHPSASWVTAAEAPDGTRIHAVIVVGGGQSGILIAAALKREGVEDVVVLDRAPRDQEGVWTTFARMEELRTPKAIVGLEFGCPALSVQAWYSLRHGAAAWAALERIPRQDWADYLRWYRDTLRIAVENDTDVADIRAFDPEGQVIAVETRLAGETRLRLARAVVIATGYDGAGGWRVPDFVSRALPEHRYDHTNGPVDFTRLRGKTVAVLGHGASAFDNANAALRAGALRVDLCFRRERLPRVNPHRHLETAGTMTHFPELDDATRWGVARHFRENDQPPPRRAFEEALARPNFHLHPGCPWLSVAAQGERIAIETPRGVLLCDHLLLATGLRVDPATRPELTSLAGRILAWRDRYQPPPGAEDARLGAYPYLDADFGFMPRDPADEWVRRIFCFNGASAVSQGPHATSISGHRHAVPRLVRGVTARLFQDQAAGFLDRLDAYAQIDLALREDFEDTIRASELRAPTPIDASIPERKADPIDALISLASLSLSPAAPRGLP